MNLITKLLISIGLKKKPILHFPHAFKSDVARNIWLAELSNCTAG